MSTEQDRTTHYQEGSLRLPGTVMLGTGVMIGAGIFALTGQMAQMTGALFPLAFPARTFGSYTMQLFGGDESGPPPTFRLAG